MTFSKIAAWVVVGTVALGCGKVRDGTDDTTHADGNGGDGNGGDGTSGDSNDGDDGGARAGGNTSGSGGRNGAGGKGSSGAGTAGGGAGGRGTGDGGASSSGGTAESGGTAGTGGSLNTGGAFVEEEGTKAMREGPTVWIGQTETVVTYPEVVSETKGPQKMVLILDRVANGVTGTVTFGSSPPPAAPDNPRSGYPPRRVITGPDGESPTFDSNWSYSPYDGFSYSIVGSELRGNSLILSFVPLELFEPWCTIQTSEETNPELCRCGDGSCRAWDGPTRRLELVVSGTTLSGQLSRPAGNWFGETPALKLERVK